jgi:hypothetical protein
MLRRLVTVTAIAAGMSIAAAITFATPALAKGPSQAQITGPGLAHPILISGNGEPGLPDVLSTLAAQTELFAAMWGANATMPAKASAALRTAPPHASRGPLYVITYTVPGVPPQPGQQYGMIRQDLYPRAVGGPVSYTPPGQQGFGGPLQVSGWLRASPHLPGTLARIGVPASPGLLAARAAHAAHPAAVQPTASRTLTWLIASAAALALAVLVGVALLLRHRRLAVHGAASP